MSIYTKNDLNKKILAKDAVIHDKSEFLGQQNRYREEEYEIYKNKKRQFLAAASAYKEYNKSALYANKIKLDEDGDNLLQYYRERICARDENCGTSDNPNGLLVRQRSYRHIYKDDTARVHVCTLEPWFLRYLKLCKFIYAARTIILRNRLLNNLRILKTWDENSIKVLEDQHRKFENVSYAELFEKFIV